MSCSPATLTHHVSPSSFQAALSIQSPSLSASLYHTTGREEKVCFSVKTGKMNWPMRIEGWHESCFPIQLQVTNVVAFAMICVASLRKRLLVEAQSKLGLYSNSFRHIQN